MANLHMGYMGHAKIGDTVYLITGSSLNPVQTVEAPDTIGGYEMRRGWNYGKVEIGGNVTGPIHCYAESLWDYAFDRNSDKDHLDNKIKVEIAYYKGKGHKFDNCYVNSLQLSATAGDVITFTVDFVGVKESENADATTAVNELNDQATADCSKLVTWDRASLDTDGTELPNIQSYTMTINNNVQRAYAIPRGSTASGGTADSKDLYPVDAPCGVREISGTISAYAEGPIFVKAGNNFELGKFGANEYTDYGCDAYTELTFKITGGSSSAPCADTDDSDIVNVTFKAVFHRPEAAATTGLSIYTLNFTAVCEAS